MHPGDPCFAGDSIGGRRVVPGKHCELVAVAVEPGDHAGRLRAQLVANSNRSYDHSVVFHQHRGRAASLRTLDPGRQGSRVQPARPSQPNRPSLEQPGQTGTWNRLDRRAGLHTSDFGQNCLSEWMFAMRLESRRQSKNLFPGIPLGR
jgi:hypothetical protein